jgi:uncharacterized integral membrane protein
MRGRSTNRTYGDGGGRTMAGWILFAVVIVLAAAFIFENTDEVTIRLLIPEVTTPLYLALLAVFLVGMGCGGYLFRRRRR